jgi:trans-AT polyketide synthase/acyltransferase/oxidoreductase domain-containing protein
VSALPLLGRFTAAGPVAFDAAGVLAAVSQPRRVAHVVRHPEGHVGVALDGTPVPGAADPGSLGWLSSLSPLYPEWLGDRSFQTAHGTRFPYIAGAMANGIGSVAIVSAMARAGMLGFFGAAGLSLPRVDAAITQLQAELGALPFGVNLIHSPQEPALETGNVELLLSRGVTRASASAYMRLTPAIVHYACTGLRDQDGRVVRRNHVFAKISRPETARHFLSPAPEAILRELVAAGKLSAEEARLAARVPLAEDVTVEADSGGHTDNRPLAATFPTIARLRDELCARHGYDRPVRVGAAGGLGTPEAVAGAFAMGAAYVLVGSVNQSCVEAGIAPEARAMLAQAGVADVAMAPAADMFELGVEVQVLRRGTLFAPRAHKLRALFERHPTWEDVPEADRATVERDLFRAPAAEVWADCVRFWQARDSAQVSRAERDPRHRFGLLCRWYLGRASRWAIKGDTSRASDWQVWCGPAQGAFNAWVAGSFLEAPDHRTVVQVARNLLEGAAVVTRAQQLRSAGVPVPAEAFTFVPRPLA